MSIAGFSKIGVIGAGQMGSGIAQVCAASGLEVVLIDSNRDQVEKAKNGIFQSVSKLASKGKLTAAAAAQVKNGLSFQHELSALAGADLVIEAVVEKEDVKAKIFRELDASLARHAVIATNTSSIPITRLAAYTKRPEQFIGLHFMNPVPLMALVEIIPGLATNSEVTQRCRDLVKALDKESVVSKDFPGFIINRILMPMINEAFAALMEGLASAEDIDKGMKLGTNQPMGPLELADFIGLDTCQAVMQVLHAGLGDPRFHPNALLAKYVEAGWLGRKTGRGVYRY